MLTLGGSYSNNVDFAIKMVLVLLTVLKLLVLKVSPKPLLYSNIFKHYL